QVDPSFGAATLDLLTEVSTGHEDREAIVSSFLNELGVLVGNTPTALVLDDFHLVDDVEDVRALVRDLTVRGPAALSWVFVGRRNPRLPVARLRTRGEVAELRTDDLRFSIDETERLFATTYRRDVDRELLRILANKTEGWAASLQLVDAALRDRPQTEVRAFIRGLTGARGDLYDYLAEEVV